MNISGNALIRARRFLGFTQPEMAARLGFSLSTYRRREALAEEYIPEAEGTHVRHFVRSEVDARLWCPQIEHSGEGPSNRGATSVVASLIGTRPFGNGGSAVSSSCRM